MVDYNTYGEVAIKAVTAKGTPEEAWLETAKKVFSHSESSQKKSCPKNAFLGLCEEGLVKKIPKGNYTKSIDNKAYALKAIEILKNNPNTTYTPIQLWQKLDLGNKSHNSQMDVVLALWNEGFINYK